MPADPTVSTALPKYLQISEMISRDIVAGRLLDGARLEPEREMARALGVAIGTLRKSLADLESKGLLERIQGSGNYVRYGSGGDTVYAKFRLELPNGGGLPRSDVLDIRQMRKPDDLPKFGISNSASRIRRLRYLNETIVALEEIWLDQSAGSVTTAAGSDSLYLFYQKNLNLWINRAEDRVAIADLPDWTPTDLHLPVGKTVGYIERFSWAEREEPVEFSRTWFDPSRALYVQRLK